MTTTLNLNLADILEQKYPHGFHAPVDIDIFNLLEFGDEDWTHEIDLEDLLDDKQLIACIWNIKLVLDERPDLHDDQAWKVLQACQPRFEEVTETMRQIVRDIANDTFPKPTGKDALRAILARIGRRIESLPEGIGSDPAAYGVIAAQLEAIDHFEEGDNQ